MIACLDVHYRDVGARAAGVVFRDWSSDRTIEEMVLSIPHVKPYEPGQFFLRELPCLLAVIDALPPVENLIIDAYVWLDAAHTPGLGAHLYEALERQIPVVGIAKTRFRGADFACEVFRGSSQRPLFITATGIAPELAAAHVRSMHGEHRIPALIKRVDYLCRQ